MSDTVIRLTTQIAGLLTAASICTALAGPVGAAPAPYVPPPVDAQPAPAPPRTDPALPSRDAPENAPAMLPPIGAHAELFGATFDHVNLFPYGVSQDTAVWGLIPFLPALTIGWLADLAPGTPGCAQSTLAFIRRDGTQETHQIQNQCGGAELYGTLTERPISEYVGVCATAHHDTDGGQRACYRFN
ncbi:hypothetical protein ACIP5Y_23620 [Nocardia sp. NPDC088792]|uniref:hypothetical protein n=1 Tax=Nocardia sp. NPDC088792 TaxID=3364332 RepID=UPI0037FE3A41